MTRARNRSRNALPGGRHVDAFHRDAQLSGGGEAGANGALGRPVQIGIVQDQQGVLAAQFERAADQPLPGPAGHPAPGGGRPGEHQVIGPGQQRLAQVRPRPQHHRPQVGRQPGLDHQVDGPQRRESSLAVGLVHDSVPGQEGGDDVPGGEGQRVVPRGDHPDHSLGVTQLRGPGQDREGAPPAARREQPRRAPPVVPGGQGDVRDLQKRVLAALAVLPLDQVQHLVLPVQQQVVEPQDHRGSFAGRPVRPVPLGGAGPGERGRHIVGRRLRQLHHGDQRGRGQRRHPGGSRRGDQAGEA